MSKKIAFVVVVISIMFFCVFSTAEAQLMGHDAIEFSTGDFRGSDYYYWMMNKSTTHEKVGIWYRNPGGIMYGDKNFDPKYCIYQTLKNGSEVLTSQNLPSVGFGGSGSNYRVHVGMGNGSGEMNLTFNRGTKYAGFANIRNSNEAVRLSLASGSAGLSWQRGWSMPVVVFKNLSSGSIRSGNVFIRIDKDHNMNLTTRSTGYVGATPMVVRASNNPYEYRISGNGTVSKARNPDFRTR